MLQQFLYFIGGFLALPFLPIVAILGKRVRKNVPSLPEASENILGHIEGLEGEIRFLTLGESTIAGVGVKDHKDGVTGQIALTINSLSQKKVHWQVLARNGYTAARVNEKLVSRIPDTPLDFIVIGLGGNDTFHLNSPLTFRKNIILCIENIQKCQPTAKIFIANMPPIADFPAFPWLIKLILGSLVQLHGAVINDLPTRFENVYYLGANIPFLKNIRQIENLNMLDYFSDGVHPSALTYHLWGKEIGGFIMKNI
jgi:lysophospholipase L1-like esterase